MELKEIKIGCLKKNDVFYFNSKEYTVIRKRNETHNREFLLLADYPGNTRGLEEFSYNELFVGVKK